MYPAFLVILFKAPSRATAAGTSSIFSVSPVKAEGPNGYSDPEENSAPGREVPRVHLSPTMRYSGLEAFAPKVQYVLMFY